MYAAEAGEQCAGGGGADAGELHQAFAAGVFAGGLGDGFVVLGNEYIESVGVGEQVADALVGVARYLQVLTDVAAQAGDFRGGTMPNSISGRAGGCRSRCVLRKSLAGCGAG